MYYYYTIYLCLYVLMAKVKEASFLVENNAYDT